MRPQLDPQLSLVPPTSRHSHHQCNPKRGEVSNVGDIAERDLGGEVGLDVVDGGVDPLDVDRPPFPVGDNIVGSPLRHRCGVIHTGDHALRDAEAFLDMLVGEEPALPQSPSFDRIVSLSRCEGEEDPFVGSCFREDPVDCPH